MNKKKTEKEKVGMPTTYFVITTSISIGWGKNDKHISVYAITYM
jgi:hypothetical protein